jgi:hypothetical protein
VNRKHGKEGITEFFALSQECVTQLVSLEVNKVSRISHTSYSLTKGVRFSNLFIVSFLEDPCDVNKDAAQEVMILSIFEILHSERLFLRAIFAFASINVTTKVEIQEESDHLHTLVYTLSSN